MFVEEMNRRYLPKSKNKKSDIIKRLYNQEEIDKMKEKNKKKENKRKNIINWKNRIKEIRKKKNEEYNNKKEKKEVDNKNVIN